MHMFAILLVLSLLFQSAITVPKDGQCDRSRPCDSGLDCYAKTERYSQCLEKCPRCGWNCSLEENDCTYSHEQEQCNGEGWKGPLNCVDSTYCFMKDKDYSQCLKECPDETWACSFCKRKCANGICDSLNKICTCFNGWFGETCDKPIVLLVLTIFILVLLIIEIIVITVSNLPCTKSSDIDVKVKTKFDDLKVAFSNRESQKKENDYNYMVPSSPKAGRKNSHSSPQADCRRSEIHIYD